MKWIKFDKEEQFGENLKVGTIVRIEEVVYPCKEQTVRYVLVGHINESKGINDEFIERDIKYYTKDYISEINNTLEKAKNDFDKNVI